MLGYIWTTAECLDTIGFKGALEMPGTGLDGMTAVEFTDPGQRLCLVNRPAVGEVVLNMRTISVCAPQDIACAREKLMYAERQRQQSRRSMGLMGVASCWRGW